MVGLVAVGEGAREGVEGDRSAGWVGEVVGLAGLDTDATCTTCQLDRTDVQNVGFPLQSPRP